jgi:hypothetical protein
MQHLLHDARVGSRGWVLIAYRTPAQPSTARVAAWRRLHRLGALYVGPSTCLLPAELADERGLATVAEGITSAGGAIDRLRIAAFAPEAEQQLRARFNAERDEEYTEVVERAEALVAELAAESARGRFTFAEVEENDVELAKLRRWLAAVGDRDRFGAEGRRRAEESVRRAGERLHEFAERSASVEDPGGVR